MIIIGSVALNRWFDSYRIKPKDTDYIATFDEVQNFIKYDHYNTMLAFPLSDNKWHVVKNYSGTKHHFEFEIAWKGTTAEWLLDRFDGCTWASPAQLLAIKLSHRYLKNSPHFLKTMEDICFLRSMGVSADGYVDFIAAREKETYNYGHPNLNQSKKDFFSGDNIQYQYDHDDIHKSVAIMQHPAYTNYISGEVMFDKEKFREANETIKIYGVVEEALVLAAERSLIPHPGKKTPREAFLYALEKVCTSITSGEFREFAWEHYHEAVAIFDKKCYNFWNSIQQDIEKNLIKPFGAI